MSHLIEEIYLRKKKKKKKKSQFTNDLDIEIKVLPLADKTSFFPVPGEHQTHASRAILSRVRAIDQKKNYNY